MIQRISQAVRNHFSRCMELTIFLNKRGVEKRGAKTFTFLITDKNIMNPKVMLRKNNESILQILLWSRFDSVGRSRGNVSLSIY